MSVAPYPGVVVDVLLFKNNERSHEGTRDLITLRDRGMTLGSELPTAACETLPDTLDAINGDVNMQTDFTFTLSGPPASSFCLPHPLDDGIDWDEIEDSAALAKVDYIVVATGARFFTYNCV